MTKRIICYLKAIPFYLRTGEFIPHVFKDTYERAIVITDGRTFRVSENLEHTAKEHVFPNGCLIRSRCKYCGAEDLSWYRDYDEWMRYVAPRNEYS